MAELSTLARPYAKAAFEYALDHDQLNQWHQQLATAAAVVAECNTTIPVESKHREPYNRPRKHRDRPRIHWGLSSITP